MSNPVITDKTPKPHNPDGLKRALNKHGLEERVLITSTVMAGDLVAMNDAARDKASIKNVIKLAERKSCLDISNSVSMAGPVANGLVFNDKRVEAFAREKDPCTMFIASDSMLGLHKRSGLGYACANALVAGLPVGAHVERGEWGSLVSAKTFGLYDVDEALCRASVADYVMASGGTQHGLGRLEAALPGIMANPLIRVPTSAEVEVAYNTAGFLDDTRLGSTLSPHPILMETWPMVKALIEEEAEAVGIVRGADLGIPYLVKANNEDALSAAIRMAHVLMRDPDWSSDAGAAYTRALENQPALVTCLLKMKTDLYKIERLKAAKARVYVVLPGHIKLFLARGTQPYATECKASLPMVAYYGKKHAFVDVPQALRYLRSSQKCGVDGAGPFLIVASLDAQLRSGGAGFTTCGDDMVFALLVVDTSAPGNVRIVIVSIDQSNFDLTQRVDVMYPIDTRIAAGLAQYDANISSLWAAIAHRRKVVCTGGGVLDFTGVGASGITLQSERNDVLSQVFGMRILGQLQALRADPGLFGDGMPPVFALQPKQLENLVMKAGKSLGLESRVDGLVSTIISQTEARACPLLSAMQQEGHTRFGFIGSQFTVGHEAISQEMADLVRLRVVVDGKIVAYDEVRTPYRAVTVVSAPERLLRNILYQSRYIKEDVEFIVTDCVRILGTIINSGSTFRYGMNRSALELTLEMCRSKLDDAREMELAALREAQDALLGGTEDFLRKFDMTFDKSAFVLSQLPMPKDREQLKAFLTLDWVLATLEKVWNPNAFPDYRPPRNAAADGGIPYSSNPVVVGSTSWADIVEEEELDEVAQDLQAMGLNTDEKETKQAMDRYAAFVARGNRPHKTDEAARSRFGRPPPILRTLAEVAQRAANKVQTSAPARPGPNGGSSATVRTRAKNKRKKLREREARETQDRDQEEYFEEQREIELEALDIEELMARAKRRDRTQE